MRIGTVVCLALEGDAYADLTHPKQVVVLLRRGILGECCGRNLMLSCLRAISIGRSASHWDAHLFHVRRSTKLHIVTVERVNMKIWAEPQRLSLLV